MVYYAAASFVMIRTQHLEMVALRIVPLKLVGCAVLMGVTLHVHQTVAILDVAVMEFVEGHPVLG